ncbi:MAG: CPBP family intramembrane metalloprotease [Jatrophihabitans sp.]|nr:MAG: CPBP family intramembrane metalloprotease [Jatrophihabitans sp.]
MTAAPAVAGRRLRPAVGLAIVLLVLIGVNVATHVVHAFALWVGPLLAVALVLFARRAGLNWSQLGLSRRHLWSGVKWGLLAVAVVGAVYVVGILVPLTRVAFLDSRYHLAVSGALFTAFVVIPVGTVVFEEVAFRSVLWGLLSRHVATWRVMVISSLLFGLWHVLPSLHLASANRGVGDALRSAGGMSAVLAVAGAVLVTTIGGLIAGELRRRSGSVLASAAMHWATNSLGVLFGLVAWQLAG